MSYKPYDPVESKDNYKPAPSLSALKRSTQASTGKGSQDR